MLELIAKFIALAILTIVGIFIVPIALLFAKDNKLPKWAWIWDNDRDKIQGDGGFKNEHCPNYGLRYGSFACNYIWLALRNPCANFVWYVGVNEIIVDIKHTWYGSLATGTSGKQYPLIYFKNNRVEFYLGYKNDNAEVGKLVPYNIGIACRIKLT